MKIIVTKNYDELSQKSFEVIKQVVTENPFAVLGLATGSTPLGTYALMQSDHKHNKTSYKNVTIINLDEYVGLRKNHCQSYAYFMQENLFCNIDVDEKNCHIPNGMAESLQNECERYSALLQTHKQDLQLLGVGPNGHIAFNEPNTPFDSLTHVTTLTQSTILANSRFFNNPNEVPKQALTMGMKEILQAKKILFLATGKSKAQIVKKMLEKVSIDCPASALLLHPDVTVILDEESASLL